MRILLTGASGQLGSYLLRELDGQTVVAWRGSQAVDLANVDAVAAAFREARPALVIHPAAIASVAECYRAPERAWSVNAQATGQLAELADRAGTRLLLVSTDLVFDGERGGYREEDVPAPLSIYGRTKAAAEQAVLACPNGVVVRVSLLFGPTLVGRPSFFDQQVQALRAGQPLTLFRDEWRTPISLLTAARGLLDIARSDFRGLLHLGGPERLSRLEMGQRLAHSLGLSDAAIVPATRAQFASAEPRPRDTSLDSSRWRGLFPGAEWPAWDEAMRQLREKAEEE
jgi:dTDP-4-dehydrorhamnose reductase